MELETHGFPRSMWQEVLPTVLHSIRTLLCTATNVTPHERLLGFPRRSGTGTALPTWLATPGPVLLRRYVRASKQEPLVDEVELLEANTHYAHVRHGSGRETTVSIRDLAPFGEVKITGSSEPDVLPQVSEDMGASTQVPEGQATVGGEAVEVQVPQAHGRAGEPSAEDHVEGAQKLLESPPQVRRSTRESKPPDWWKNYVVK